MGQASIIRAFGFALIILGAAMLVPYFIALGSEEAHAEVYLFGAALTIFIGSGAFLASSDRRMPADLRGAVVLILLWWIVAPIFAAIPFLLTEYTPLDAYFEALSAITTTGAWLSIEGAVASPSGMIWRAQLQWLGGLASLAIAAAIFIRPAFIGIDTLLPPFSRGDRASYIKAIQNAAFGFLWVYLLITVLCFGTQMLAGMPILQASVVAMSAVSSGGFVPHADGLGHYPFAVTGTLLPFIILGGANFVLITRLLRGSARRNRDVESGVYLLAIAIVGVVYWIANGAGDIDLIPAQIFNAASLFSTNGYLVGDMPTLPLALITVIIGGSAVSTAGGFKILRWLVIFQRAREEVRLLVTPKGVFGKSAIANELGVWIHFLVFTMTLGAMMLFLTLAGHSFELSAATATGILANAGPVIVLAESGADYQIFNGPIKILLCIGMILGRLEAVVALAIINHAFWRS